MILVLPAFAAEITDLAEYRAIGTAPPDIVVDADGRRTGQVFVLDQRLRLGLDAAGTGWRLGTEWDLLSGQVVGDVWAIPGQEDERRRWELSSFTLDGIAPRRLSAGIDTPHVRFDVGLQTSTWGLGLVANDGATDPLFGRNDFGDRVIRARTATRLTESWTLVAATDLVAADDTARLDREQIATQAILALVHGVQTPTSFGLYGVGRHQAEPNDRVTDVLVLDLYGRTAFTHGAWDISSAVEGAAITGRTTRSLSYGGRQGLDVLSGGIAGRAKAASERFDVHLRGGWLSGDGNPDDAVSNSFTADRDFDVGMVIFDEVQGAIDAAAYAQLTDPSYSGQGPDGADLIVTEGAVRSAAWVQPAIVTRPTSWLELRVGGVFAWSTAPISQSFNTFRNGGVPTNHLGAETTGYYLGTEVDWAIVVGDGSAPGGTPLTEVRIRPSFMIQGASAWLSEDLGGGRVDLVSGAVRVRM